ncbi:hypothetical protein GCM10009679_59580 [Saccharothrix algeriensis]|uniref:Uncharacterized protein n=2 Tax=Catellatospora bangladeshensis TaxID=310355 RepID=A0A8J3JQQ7_9ACTN|nr:hypothetical protein Cba03nite_44970 [Catellatospora bangladeshensis]
MTLREAVMARPRMYFGDAPHHDRPIILLAWAVGLLQKFVLPQSPRVRVVVRTDGAFEVGAQFAVVPIPRSLDTVEEVLLGAAWWTELCRSSHVTASGQADAGSDEFGLRLVEVESPVMQFACDPDVVGAGAQTWWPGWLDRLPSVLAAMPSPSTHDVVIAVDQATGEQRILRPSRAE